MRPRHGRSPTLGHMKVFGCVAYTRKLGPTSKLDDHGEAACLLVMREGAKAYRVFEPVERCRGSTRDVVFDEEHGGIGPRLNLGHRRNSWEIWENYSKVALDTGNIRLTLEALKTVLNLSSNKRFNVGILDKVMTTLEEQSPNFVDTHKASDDANKETRQSNQLLDIIGDILQQIVRSGGSNADIWGLYARWHKTKGNLMACSEALLKQVRSLQGSELWHDQTKFAKYAQASLKLCKVYMEISSSTGSRRELLTAEMHLKSTLKQAMDFSDTEEYKVLDNCLEEIKNMIAATA
ncbi:unnamed protein product [Miscanthus lutarioriparius]|uniref:Uncharacterized protein n=1 Tax=Miscanthus lutarioriparius TaxID=422564 RepID=A0A811N8W3_9POAL|nr:unnamed protein product [Miscanthus lutarioriparius]